MRKRISPEQRVPENLIDELLVAKRHYNLYPCQISAKSGIDRKVISSILYKTRYASIPEYNAIRRAMHELIVEAWADVWDCSTDEALARLQQQRHSGV